jgi:hypothetical protein
LDRRSGRLAVTPKRRLTLPWLTRDGTTVDGQDEQQVADAIYGLIVGAAVMAASHAPGSGRIAISVLVTLLVYWSAERYAAIVAGRIAAGHRRSRGTLRRELADGWGLLTSSFIPIVVLLAFDLFGADLKMSVLAGLVCSTALLCLAGLQIGAAARLSTRERVAAAAAAGAFGLVLIALKVALH